MASSGNKKRVSGWDRKPKEEKPDEEEKKKKDPVNAFQNDGSFMEMFKKMQEGQGQSPTPTTTSASGGAGSNKEAMKETETPCYATQTIYYKDSTEGSTSQKPLYQVTTTSGSATLFRHKRHAYFARAIGPALVSWTRVSINRESLACETSPNPSP